MRSRHRNCSRIAVAAMPSDRSTVQFRSSLMRVVIVHESPRPCLALAEALRASCVVRMACSLGELREQIGLLDRLACVVCVSSRALRARDARDEAVRLGVAPERIVVLGLEELAQHELALAIVREAMTTFHPQRPAA